MDSDDSPTHRALVRLGRHLDLPLSADLGELVKGHHVVATGLELATPSGGVLHHEFLPGITEKEIEASPFFWYWALFATDDVGTRYDDSNAGAVASTGGEASHAERDIGGVVPAAARTLVLRIEPAQGWTPLSPWQRELVIELPLRDG